MCGIIGYVGSKKVVDVLVTGLERLEYRGYDSAGVAVLQHSEHGSGLALNKVVGRVSDLKQHLANVQASAYPAGVSAGIAHTRWATHGQPNEANAHPHMDCSGKISIVHNGIIENFLEIKSRLTHHTFSSKTDTEVIAHLIEEYYIECGNLKKAVQLAIKDIHGTYALCVIHKSKNEIIVARNGSPLLLGLGENETFVASDVSAIIEHTKRVVYLNDFETGVIRHDSYEVFDKDGRLLEKDVKTIDWSLEQSQKQGFKHFMMKEMHEQPHVVSETARISFDTLTDKSGKPFDLSTYKKIFIVACGSASYAGLAGKYVLEQAGRIPVELDVASEFRYRKPLIGEGDLLIVVSQSGETADTLAAMRLAKEKGAATLGIINVVDSTIAREADAVLYTRAGPEICVASTKAFISQLVVFYRLAEKLGGKQLGLEQIPALIQRILDQKDAIYTVAQKYYKVYNFIYIGRNMNYPIALEGALKLKEISYIHAEGYASGEMKHGPIALVTDEVPTVAIVPRDSVYPKMISNIQEIRARNGKVIALASEGDEEIKQHCTDVIYIPMINELLNPLLTVVVAQLFAYYMADLRHCDIDKPRNLAKSVTVE